MTHQYILADDDETPIPCEDPMAWARWFENAEQRTVAKTTVGDAHVSTVFLGLDHDFSGKGPPILWETMIFGGAHDQEYQERYTSLADAREGHERAVALLRAGVPA